MDKRFHSDRRSSENFTIKGLQTITGQSQSDWITYITKEISDNSLEACENPKIKITGWLVNKELVQLDIQDNGPGITKKTIMKIFQEIETFGGTKSHYKLTTRGSQGNALMSIFGIQSQFIRPLEIYSKNYLHTVKLIWDDLQAEPDIQIETKKMQKNIKGLKVSFSPRIDGGGYEDEDFELGDIDDVKKVFTQFVELNPQAEIKLIIRNKRTILSEWLSEKTGEVQRLTLGRKTTTGKVIWFSFDDFLERLKADIRVEPDLLLKDWIGEFYGFTSLEKVKQVISIFDSEGKFETIKDFFSKKRILTDDITRMYDQMKAVTKTFREDRLATTLGSIGKEGMKAGLLHSLDFLADIDFNDDEEMHQIEQTWGQILGHHSAKESKIKGVDDLFFYCGKGGINKSYHKTIPYYFELIAVPISWKKKTSPSEKITFGINQSFVYSIPDIHFEVKRRGLTKDYYRITSPFEALSYQFKIICNLTCPTIDYRDRGKQLFDTTPFKDTIEEVVSKVVRKIGSNLVPILSKMNKKPEEVVEAKPKGEVLTNKAPKGIYKNFVFKNFMPVYNEATENGKYILTQRQFYYAMRRRFMAYIQRQGYQWRYESTIHNKIPLDLQFETCNNNLAKYEVDVLKRRIIHRDPRGFFTEPFSNQRVNLSTVEVKNYTPDLSEFNNLLFVEKSGFFELLHDSFKFTKRYDLGLISSQGWGTLALRDLVEQIQRERSEIKLYTLTDLDIAGIGIRENIEKPDELSIMETFNCKEVGLKLEDVRKYNLEIEKANYKPKELTMLRNKYERGEVEEDLYEFFKKDQRVELNVFSPVELRNYLETRFKELGIEKLKPEEEEVRTFKVDSPDVLYRRALSDAIAEFTKKSKFRLFDFLKKKVKVEGSEAEKKLKELSEDQQKIIYEDILEELEKFPPKNWVAINAEKIGDIESDHEKIKRDYQSGVKERAMKVLEEEIQIEVSRKIKGRPRKEGERR